MKSHEFITETKEESTPKVSASQRKQLQKIKGGQSLNLAAWASKVLDKGTITDAEAERLSKLFESKGISRAVSQRYPDSNQINELDNGPNGTYSDNINYGKGRSTQTNFSKTASQKAAIPSRPEPAPKAKTERIPRQPKPKADPKPRIARFNSSEPQNELEQRAKSAMYDVWQRIGGDVPDMQDPYEIAEVCTDANRLQLVLDMSPEEEREILDLGQKTLARLASNFGY